MPTSESARATVEMRFEDNSAIDAWLEFSLRDTFTDPLAECSFVAKPTRDRLPFYQKRLTKGALISLLVNKASQGQFLIQGVKEIIGRNGYEFQVLCHTPLVTPYQGCIDPDYSFSTNNDTPVTSILREALLPFGFDAIEGDSSASVNASTGSQVGRKGKRSKLALDPLKANQAHAQDGERAYAFASRLLTRLGAVLRYNLAGAGTSKLLAQAPDYEQEALYTLLSDPAQGTSLTATRFLGDVEIEDTNDDQYSYCEVRGGRGDSGSSTTTSEPIARVASIDLNANRPAYKSASAPHKPLFVKDRSARDVDAAKRVATLALGLRAAKAFTIVGSVDGLIAETGRVWTTGTLARVVIVDKSLDEPMFILERVLTMSRDQAQTTRLKLIPKNSLLIGDPPGN